MKINSNSVPTCPVCRQPGQKVNQKTVSSLLKPDLIHHMSSEDYFICLSRQCPVSYYTKAEEFFKKEDIKVPIWFKEESPVTICYCKDISDEDIMNHIVDRQCCADIEDIQLHTGANTGKECLTKNPAGK